MREKEPNAINIIKESFESNYNYYSLNNYHTKCPIVIEHEINFCLYPSYCFNTDYKVNINFDHIVENCHKNKKKYYILINSDNIMWIGEYINGPSQKYLHMNWCTHKKFVNNIEKLINLIFEYCYKKYINEYSTLDLVDFIWFNNFNENYDLFKLFKDSPVKNLKLFTHNSKNGPAFIFELFVSDEFYNYLKINEIKNV